MSEEGKDVRRFVQKMSEDEKGRGILEDKGSGELRNNLRWLKNRIPKDNVK